MEPDGALKTYMSHDNLFSARHMEKTLRRKKMGKYTLPLVIERDEDGFFVIECPVFTGCYTQGKTLDEALKNIEEVIDLCLEEKDNQEILKEYVHKEFTFTTITL